MKKFFETPICSIEMMLQEDILTISANNSTNLDENKGVINFKQWSEIWKS